MKYAVSRCYIFTDDSVWFMDNMLSLCDVWKGPSYVNSNISVSSMFNNGKFYPKYYFLRYRNSHSKRFSEVLIAKSLLWISIHQSTKSTTRYNICNILEEHPKTLLKMFLMTSQTNVLKTLFLSIFFKMHFYIAFLIFSILTISKHTNM